MFNFNLAHLQFSFRSFCQLNNSPGGGGFPPNWSTLNLHQIQPNSIGQFLHKNYKILNFQFTLNIFPSFCANSFNSSNSAIKIGIRIEQAQKATAERPKERRKSRRPNSPSSGKIIFSFEFDGIFGRRMKVKESGFKQFKQNDPKMFCSKCFVPVCAIQIEDCNLFFPFISFLSLIPFRIIIKKKKMA